MRELENARIPLLPPSDLAHSLRPKLWSLQARQRASIVRQLDDPGQRAVVEADPARALAGSESILIVA